MPTRISNQQFGVDAETTREGPSSDALESMAIDGESGDTWLKFHEGNQIPSITIHSDDACCLEAWR